MDSASRKKRKIKRIVGLCVCGVLVIAFALAAYFTVAISGEIRGKNVSEETGVITVEVFSCSRNTCIAFFSSYCRRAQTTMPDRK